MRAGKGGAVLGPIEGPRTALPGEGLRTQFLGLRGDASGGSIWDKSNCQTGKAERRATRLTDLWAVFWWADIPPVASGVFSPGFGALGWGKCPIPGRMVIWKAIFGIMPLSEADAACSTDSVAAGVTA